MAGRRVLRGVASTLLAALPFAMPARAGAEPIDGDTGGSLAPAERLPRSSAVVSLGCVPSLSAANLTTFFADRLGPILGWDNPKLIPLGEGRTLWLVNDPYVDLTMTATTLLHHDYLNNTALIEDGSCFSLFQRLDGGDAVEFAADRPNGHFFWPLGGTVGAGGLIYVFWSEMREDGPHPDSDGITRHPVATWLGVYDQATLTQLQFMPAPNAGVFPQYGSAVQTWGSYTYLFGNSNMLNLTREGGFWNGPFSGTRMYVARVPAGQLWLAPQYFTGAGWSTHAAEAAPFSTRWYASNAMQPRLIDGQWFSVVKKDEYWGDTVVVEHSSRPQGPWSTIASIPAVPRVPTDRSGVPMSTYQPVLLPGRGTDGRLIAVLSQNSADWLVALDDPRLYRPQALAVRS